MRLKDKIALITGGANGIGLATVTRFAKEGAKIILWDVSDQGRDVADHLIKEGHEAIFKRLSVVNATEVQSAVKEAHNHFGRIDILINNAGITRDRTLLNMAE
jgi:3-oxoacyl-[acyl-carrier protein] reductase